MHEPYYDDICSDAYRDMQELHKEDVRIKLNAAIDELKNMEVTICEDDCEEHKRYKEGFFDGLSQGIWVLEELLDI